MSASGSFCSRVGIDQNEHVRLLCVVGLGGTGGNIVRGAIRKAGSLLGSRGGGGSRRHVEEQSLRASGMKLAGVVDRRENPGFSLPETAPTML